MHALWTARAAIGCATATNTTISQCARGGGGRRRIFSSGSGLDPQRRKHHATVWAHLNANTIAISNQLLRSAHSLTGCGARGRRRNGVDADELREYAYRESYDALRSMVEEGYAVPVRGGDNAIDDPPLENGNVTPPEQQMMARSVFYLGDPDVYGGAAVGLVNVAAFLLQASADLISHGSCDELNADVVDATSRARRGRDGRRGTRTWTSTPSRNACAAPRAEEARKEGEDIRGTRRWSG